MAEFIKKNQLDKIDSIMKAPLPVIRPAKLPLSSQSLETLQRNLKVCQSLLNRELHVRSGGNDKMKLHIENIQNEIQKREDELKKKQHDEAMEELTRGIGDISLGGVRKELRRELLEKIDHPRPREKFHEPKKPREIKLKVLTMEETYVSIKETPKAYAEAIRQAKPMLFNCVEPALNVDDEDEEHTDEESDEDELLAVSDCD